MPDEAFSMFAGDAYKLLERTTDAAFVVTPEGEICFRNTAAEQLFGYSTTDVLNKTCYSVLQGVDTLGTVVCMGEGNVQHCAAQGRPIQSFDLEVTTRSGQRIWVSISTLYLRTHATIVSSQPISLETSAAANKWNRRS